jgi:hypothetical protein
VRAAAGGGGDEAETIRTSAGLDICFNRGLLHPAARIGDEQDYDYDHGCQDKHAERI